VTKAKSRAKYEEIGSLAKKLAASRSAGAGDGASVKNGKLSPRRRKDPLEEAANFSQRGPREKEDI